MAWWIGGWLWIAADLLVLLGLMHARESGFRNLMIVFAWASGIAVLVALNAL